MMGFVSHGVWVVLVCLFALWGGGAALVIGKQSEKMTHVSTCEGLKRALGHELPHQDVLVDEDITCTQEEWGEEPVIVYGEKMVMGVHIPPYDIPSVQFIDVVDGIVVAGEASLAIQKIRLKSEVSGQDPRGNGTHPPHFVKLLQSATLDFVGSQVCCPDCNIRVQEKIIDHKLIDGQAYVENSMPYTGPARSDAQVEGNPVIEQAPSSLCDSNPEYIKWAAGEFVGGGSYHLCSSTASCKSDQSTNSAFVYYVDRTMQICQTSATVMILSHRETHAPRMSRTVEIVAIFVPSALCVVLMVLLAILVRRPGSNADEKYRTFSTGEKSMDFPTREITALRPCHQRTSIQEEISGTEQAHSDEDSVVVSTTALSFGGVHVDLTRLLGQGGFSSVYKGTFQGNLAAVKIVEHNQCLKAERSGELAEVQLHRNLYHPYIVVTYCSKDVSIDILPLGYGDRNSPSMSIGLSRSCSPSNLLPARRGKSNPTSSTKGPGDNKCTLIVMEFCERGNLFEAIHQGEFFRQDMRGAPDFLVILRCALDVAVAMRYLHSKGIVHGDLKPENVLRKSLAEDDRGFICKVSDFGLSRMIPINTFLQTATLGTITHMPPELLRDGILAPSADIYSFGIMLWEMISGGFPFQGMSQHDIILAVVGGTRPTMPRFIPRDLWTLIQDCWHEDHFRRPSFTTVVGVLQGALKEVLHGSPSYPSLSVPSIPEITFRRSAETPPDKSTESTPTPSTTPCASSESTTPLSGFEAWEPFGETGFEVDHSQGTTSVAGLRSEQPRQATDPGFPAYDSYNGVNQVKYHRPIAQGTSYQDTRPALIWNSLKGQDGHSGVYHGNRIEPAGKWTEGQPGLHTVDHSLLVHAAVNPLSNLESTSMHNSGEQGHLRNKNASSSEGFWGPTA